MLDRAIDKLILGRYKKIRLFLKADMHGTCDAYVFRVTARPTDAAAFLSAFYAAPYN